MTSQLGKVSHTFAHMPQDDPQTRRARFIFGLSGRGAELFLSCFVEKRAWARHC